MRVPAFIVRPLMDPANYTIVLERGLLGSNASQAELSPAISGWYTNAQAATLQFQGRRSPASTCSRSSPAELSTTRAMPSTASSPAACLQAMAGRAGISSSN